MKLSVWRTDNGLWTFPCCFITFLIIPFTERLHFSGPVLHLTRITCEHNIFGIYLFIPNHSRVLCVEFGLLCQRHHSTWCDSWTSGIDSCAGFMLSQYTPRGSQCVRWWFPYVLSVTWISNVPWADGLTVLLWCVALLGAVLLWHSAPGWVNVVTSCPVLWLPSLLFLLYCLAAY